METLRTLATGSESGTLRTLVTGSELGTLRTLATATEWEPLERSLAVVNWELLERSLAVVNLGTLRTLATGSGVLTGSDGRSLLERSLPVVSVLRVPPESSTQGSSCVFAGVVLRRTQDLGWSSDSKTPQVQSLPVVSVLTGSDGRSLLERSI